MEIKISNAERKFIVDGIEHNIRNDGRQRIDVCSFDIKPDVLPFCMSSAEINLHGTRIIVGIKLEITNPDVNTPSLGQIETSVKWYVIFFFFFIVQIGIGPLWQTI